MILFSVLFFLRKYLSQPLMKLQFVFFNQFFSEFSGRYSKIVFNVFTEK